MSSFRSKRLRVQLPCGEPTIVDAPAADEGGTLSPGPCDIGFVTPPQCAHLTCFDLPCHAQFATPCIGDSGPGGGGTDCPAGFITPDLHCPHGTISLPGCPDSRPQTGCVFGNSGVCIDFDTHPKCGIDSCLENTGCYGTLTIFVVGDAEEGTIQVDSEALPQLRKRLEQRLRQIEQAELSKAGVEERLREIAAAEEELRKRDEQQ